MKKKMYRIKVTWRNKCFGKMDDHPVHTTPNHQPTTLPKWMFSRKLLFKSALLLKSVAFKYIPQTTATTFAFSSVFILLLWHILQEKVIFRSVKRLEIMHWQHNRLEIFRVGNLLLGFSSDSKERYAHEKERIAPVTLLS